MKVKLMNVFDMHDAQIIPKNKSYPQLLAIEILLHIRIGTNILLGKNGVIHHSPTIGLFNVVMIHWFIYNMGDLVNKAVNKGERSDTDIKRYSHQINNIISSLRGTTQSLTGPINCKPQSTEHEHQLKRQPYAQ